MKNKIVKLTEKQLKKIIENQLNNNKQEYYVGWSSWFDTHPYDEEQIMYTISSSG